MSRIIFLRHFDVKIDKNKPQSEWELSDAGKKAMVELINSKKLRDIDKIFTSMEKKAKITAEKIAEKYNIQVVLCSELTEVDRSKAGFIEDNYVEIVKQYLSNSDDFKYNWEKINDVKKRIRKFFKRISKESGNILVISHGLFLSILLSPYFKRKMFDFWKKLKFGHMFEIDLNEFKSYAMNYD